MLDAGAFVLLLEFFLFLFGIPAAFMVVKKLTRETKVSNTIVIIRDGKRTNNKVICSLLKKETGKNGRVHFTVMPKDCSKPKPFTIISESNKNIPYPMGGWSGEKNIIEILPNSAQDYMNNMMEVIETKTAESNIIKAQKEGIRRQASHLMSIGEGELSDVNMGLAKDFQDKLLKSQLKADGKGTSGGYASGETFRS